MKKETTDDLFKVAKGQGIKLAIGIILLVLAVNVIDVTTIGAKNDATAEALNGDEQSFAIQQGVLRGTNSLVPISYGLFIIFSVGLGFSTYQKACKVIETNENTKEN